MNTVELIANSKRSKMVELIPNTMPIMRINSPEIFADSEFMKWLNDPETIVATWHKKGTDAGEYSDVFVTYDNGEGSNSDMPEHMICDTILNWHNRAYDDCLIWLSNLESEQD